MDPDEFARIDWDQEQWERRQEWPKLHGDCETKEINHEENPDLA